MSKINTGLLAAVAFCMGGFATLAWSQQAPSSGQAAAPSQDGLEEVIVTAEKRSENLQITPLSITALSGEQLADRNITNVLGYAELVPNLTVNPIMGSATAASVYIRGVGYANTEAYVDSPVATYIDGVLYPRPNVAGLELVDIAQVEVLRGPQGTLFGRNTTGGALNITTRAPSDDFGFKQNLQYGTFQEFVAKSVLDTGRIADTSFKANLVYYHHQDDGYVTNLTPGADFNAGYLNSDNLWFHLQGELAPHLTMDYRFDYTKLEAVMPASQIITAGSNYVTYFGNSPNVGGDPFNNSPTRLGAMYLGIYGPEKNTDGGHSLNLEYDVTPGMTLKNLVAYRDQKSSSPDSNVTGQGNLRGLVADPTTGAVSVQNVTPFNAQEGIIQHQISDELQAIGTLGRFKYVGGLFYFNEVPKEDNPLTLTSILPGNLVGVNIDVPRNFALNTTSKAAYTQWSFTPPGLDDKLELTAGGRYTKDDKSITEPGVYMERSWSKTSGAASAQYSWTPDLMTYVRVASAYKAGGFTPGFPGSYDPENALLTEVGLKSDWFDHRLRVNATAYNTNYKDLQLQETVGGIPLVTNAGRAIYRGGELEITAAPVRRLRFTGTLGMIDPDYKTYIYSDPVLGNINVANEVHLTYAAKLNYTVGVQADLAEGPLGTLTGILDFHYESHRWFFPLDRQLPYNELISGPSIHDMTARLTWNDLIKTSNGATFSAYIYGTNLLNQIDIVTGTDWSPMNFASAVFSRPRTVGLGIDMRF
jgi:iron complex outermembrane recepter protein